MRKAGPVGRADVLDGLRRVVDQAVTGRGQIMLLAGEAGIGKTTMLAAAADYAESRGARVAWGWGWPGEGAPGYWPWVQVMRTLGLDIPWPPGLSGQKMTLFRALARRQEDSDMFFGVVAGSIPLRQLMSPRTMVRLVGAGGFVRLAFSQARPQRAAAAPGPQSAEGISARSAENASAT